VYEAAQKDNENPQPSWHASCCLDAAQADYPMNETAPARQRLSAIKHFLE
jgi:hypothetical protein